jgi:hypothetical protein
MPQQPLKRPAEATESELDYVRSLIERIVRECPSRRPTGPDEERAQKIMAEEFERLGIGTHEAPFKFNENLYANLAIHTGLGTLGTAVSGLAPAVGFAMHMLAGTSYLLDTTRRAFVLRRLLPFKESRNLVATLPAQGEPKLRLVIMAHADAAFTGLMWNEKLVRALCHPDGSPGRTLMERPLHMFVASQYALAGFDLLRMVFGPLTWPLRPLEAALTLPSLATFLLNLQIVWHNEIVPGANDDLSGVAALPILAARLGQDKHPDVELVFVVTGCEEASLGGADALVRQHKHDWSPNNTVFMALDCLGNGELRFNEVEGEVVRRRIPGWLSGLATQVANSEPRFAEVRPFEIPAGGTDVLAALHRGYPGVALTCIRPGFGSPGNYHLPSDTPENLDMDKVIYSTDYAEKLIRAIVAYRVGQVKAPTKLRLRTAKPSNGKLDHIAAI